MAQHNDLLYNATAQAVVAAATDGTDPLSSASFTTLVANAETIAAQIDTAIANDATISNGGGTAIAGSLATSAQTAAQFAKTQALGQIVFACLRGKTVIGALDASTVAGIVALYTASIASIQTG